MKAASAATGRGVSSLWATVMKRSASIDARGTPSVQTQLPGNVLVLETKLAPPRLHRELVERPALIARLASTGGLPMIALLAPAGYGKSTLLAQWAACDPRPFAWLSLDARDNDPALLLGYIATAVHRVAPLPPGVLRSLAELQRLNGRR